LAIAREGYDSFTAKTDQYNASCTIPASTTCIVFAGAGYDTDGLASITLGSQTFSIDIDQVAAGGGDCAYMAHLFSPSSTGAQTIAINWDSSRDYLAQMWFIYYSGTDTSSLRDTDSQQNAYPSTLTFTTQSGDVVVCVAALDSAATWTNATEVVDVYNDGLYGTFAQCAADGTSEQITVTDLSTGWGGIVLIPAAGGASSTPLSTLARGIAVGMFKGMGIGSGQYP